MWGMTFNKSSMREHDFGRKNVKFIIFLYVVILDLKLNKILRRGQENLIFDICDIILILIVFVQ